MRKILALVGALGLVGCKDAMPPPLDGSMPKDGSGGDTATGDGMPPGDSGAPPICPPGFTFGNPNDVPGVTASDKMFASISPDELSIAWVTPQGTVVVADRADASQPFGNPQNVPGTFEHDRVALSADGLTIIVVLPKGTGFGQLTRPMRGQAFGGNVDTAPFKELAPVFGMEGDAGAADSGLPQKSIGDPVLSADGKQMFFGAYDRNNTGTINFSEKVGNGWLKPVTLNQNELTGTVGKRMRPTGLSSDGRTLFFYDQIDMKERAGTRKTATSFDFVFANFVDLADRIDAQPNSACTKLYFSRPVMAPQDVKFANRN